MKKLLILVLLPFLPLLTQCSSSGAGSHAALPILSSPARANAWGTPTVQKSASGYRSTYTNPKNSKEKVHIIGSQKMMAFFRFAPHIKGSTAQASQPQQWNKALMRGTTVKWYQVSFATAEKAAKFSTLGIKLKDQSGRPGQFKIEIEGTKNQVPSWLAELRFDN